MFPTTSKRLLINHIRHADTHNRIVEENEMWKSYDKLKEKGIESSYSFLDDKREDMGMEHFNRSDRRAHMDDEPLPVSKARGKDCTFWMRQLQKVEEADPDRWGHNGFKEMYPNDFVSDPSDNEKKSKKKSKGKKKEKYKKHKKHKKHKKSSHDDEDKKRQKKSSKDRDRKKFKSYKSFNLTDNSDESDSDDGHHGKHKRHKRKRQENRLEERNHRDRRKKKSKKHHSKKSGSRSQSPYRSASKSRSRSPLQRQSDNNSERHLKSTKRKLKRRLRRHSSSSSSSDTEDENYINYKRNMKKLADYVSNGGLTVTKNRHRKVPKRTSQSASNSNYNASGDNYFTVSDSDGQMDSY